MPVEKDNRELFYRQLAALYADADGERLLRERAALEQDSVQRITPGLDRRVRAIPGRAKRRRNTRIAGLIAAVLVIALLAPQLLRYNQQNDVAAAPEATTESAAPGEMAPAEQGADEAVPEAAPEMAEDAPAAGAGDYEIIPLSATLPANLTQIGVEQDNAQSIYYLSDQRQDDVVLTMEYSDSGPATDGLVQIDLDGHTTWGAVTGDYSLLTFEQDGILYTMTCKYDINTLLPLGRSILI